MIDSETVTQTYRDKAARCRRLADQTTDREVAERLSELAREFEEEAKKAEKQAR